MFYGLTHRHQIKEMATAVCDVLGHGKNRRAVALLVETCAAETHLGMARDKTLYGAGAGVPQIDEGTFNWLKKKYADHPIGGKISQAFNIDLGRVNYRELDLSPLTALVFCRLRYWTVTDAIPATRPERAAYWKRWYNSSEGKGSPEEYLERCEASGVDEVMGYAPYA